MIITIGLEQCAKQIFKKWYSKILYLWRLVQIFYLTAAAETAGTPSGEKAPVVPNAVKWSCANITGMAAASNKKKDLPAAKQPQGAQQRVKFGTARIRWWEKVAHASM